MRAPDITKDKISVLQFKEDDLQENIRRNQQDVDKWLELLVTEEKLK